MSAEPRDAYSDSLKGALILLVVYGHLIEPYTATSTLIAVLYTAIYVFHIPLFVLLSGHFSSANLDERGYRNLVTRLILPLVVYQFLYLSVVYLARGGLVAPVTQPFWVLWFLLSLISWRLLLPLTARLPQPIATFTLLAILAGYDPGIGYGMSLSRTLYFFPFFLVGHRYGERVFALARRARSYAVLAFGLGLTVAVVIVLHGSRFALLYGSVGYQATQPHMLEPGLERLAILSLSFTSAVAFAALVPARSSLLAYVGRRTMTIFLLHGFVVLGINEMGSFDRLAPPVSAIAMVPAALLIAVVLAKMDRPARMPLACLRERFGTGWRSK